eukprot:2017786-Prymnesium_polylepis.1
MCGTVQECVRECRDPRDFPLRMAGLGRPRGAFSEFRDDSEPFRATQLLARGRAMLAVPEHMRVPRPVYP